MIKTRIQDHRVGTIRPVWPARPAAARLRRARVGPILARPPIRAIQPCAHRESRVGIPANSLASRRQNVYELTKETGWF